MNPSNEASKTSSHPARRRSEREGAHRQSSVPQESLATTPVLSIHQTPIELPLDELSEKAISTLLRSAGTTGKQAACHWFRTGKYRVTEEIHGRKVARELIRNIELRLRDCLREDDVICRVSDSEFAIVLYDVNDSEDVAAIAERVLEQGRVYDNGDLRLHVTASVGIAMYPTDATRPHDLLRYARMALRDINPQHPSQYRVFSTELLSRLRDSAWTVTEIERALQQGRMVLHYQPQYAIDTQRVVGQVSRRPAVNPLKVKKCGSQKGARQGQGALAGLMTEVAPAELLKDLRVIAV
jgi:diguanylate cyclase (GGDEF)-like protein